MHLKAATPLIAKAAKAGRYLAAARPCAAQILETYSKM